MYFGEKKKKRKFYKLALKKVKTTSLSHTVHVLTKSVGYRESLNDVCSMSSQYCQNKPSVRALYPKRAKRVQTLDNMSLCVLTFLCNIPVTMKNGRRQKRKREKETLTSSISDGETGGLSVKEPQL